MSNESKKRMKQSFTGCFIFNESVNILKARSFVFLGYKIFFFIAKLKVQSACQFYSLRFNF